MTKYFIILVFFCSFGLKAQRTHRDSIDVLNYSIHIDLSKTQIGQIYGKTEVKLKAIYGLSDIKLDLERLTTDSVFQYGKKLEYNHNGTILKIIPLQMLSVGDTTSVVVYYHGTPIADEAWGGFFMGKDYAFNYGVGMAANPPNYGRVWYPCIDNFTDRAMYEYFIQTKPTQMAACPGLLQSETKQADGTKIFHWKLGQSIPTYLSSVAVGNYSVIKDTVQGIERIIPIEIYTEKGSESYTKYSFKNLKGFVHAFEYRFGPFKWDKIGYVSTNFSSGAMEHATNIAYSNYCNGNSSCESTLAHELSHHWFGDLVTCSSEKDMWLNEGWASFAEAVYYEYASGVDGYKKYVRENHRNVIIYALNNPESYGALYGMPHNGTYGSVVYNKGADVAHTLRGQIGDSLFFSALKQFFIDYAFDNISVEEFKNYFAKQTKTDLKDFFDFWIYSSGFPHFSIQNLNIKPIKNKYQIGFTIEQGLLQTQKLLNSSNIEIGVLGKDLKINKFQVKQIGKSSPQKIIVDFEPKLVILDPDEKISDAIVDEYLTIDKAFIYQFPTENMSLEVTNIKSPAFFHLAFHYTAPFTKKKTKSIKRIVDSYWEINSYSTGPIDANSKFFFQLSLSFLGNEGVMNKQNLKLVFRENEESEWEIVDYEYETNGSESVFEVLNVKQGQYSIGF